MIPVSPLPSPYLKAANPINPTDPSPTKPPSHLLKDSKKQTKILERSPTNVLQEFQIRRRYAIANQTKPSSQYPQPQIKKKKEKN